MSDITEVKRALEGRAQEVAERLLPHGVLEGRDWCAGSVSGEAGTSLKLCVRGGKIGLWSDFAVGIGGDLIDLWQATRGGLSLPKTLDEIRDYLGMPKPAFESDKRPRKWRRPERPKCTAPKSAVRAYLTEERKVSEAAILAYRIGENGRTIVFPSLLPNGELAFVKYLGVDRKPDGKKDTRVEEDCEPVLFGWQAIDENAREVTITEGEIDACTSYDYGFPALSVPFGGGKGGKQKWIESEYDRLEQFETIYLALDMDEEGEAAVGEIVDRLGRHRCKRVTLPRKDLNECRKDGLTKDLIAACFKEAPTLDPAELTRAGLYTEAVVDSFWPKEGQETGYRLPFRKIAERLVFRAGEMTLWTGATGTGKSQILGHGCVAWGDQGARICVASFEMAPVQTLRRMVKQATNTDRPTVEYIHEAMRWLDGWLWIFALVGKASVPRMLEVFEYARRRYGCDVFVIDSLMRLGIGSEDYEGQERAVYEIVSWATGKNVHVHLVAHARKAGKDHGGVPENEDVKGASEIAANAFNVVGVWRNRKHEDELRTVTEKADRGDAAAIEKLEELRDRPPVIANVSKQRNGDWEGKFGLWFSTSTYQYAGAHDERAGHAYVAGSFPKTRGEPQPMAGRAGYIDD